MPKLISKKYIGKMPVYNMTVDDVHNYITEDGIVMKNCDGLRYYASMHTYQPTAPHIETERDRLDRYKRQAILRSKNKNRGKRF